MINKSKNFKLIDETATTMNNFVVAISCVKYLHDYILEIHFDDDTIQKIDFAPFLISSRHPEVQKYLSVILFKNYTLDNGELYWGDYDLIFPITDLYTNNIQPYIPPRS